VLVVSCPCAFALAVPAAITRAIAVLARRGVLIVKPDVVQALADATHVVFDKTGTLTDAQLTLRGIETRGAVPAEHALELAAALARESRHPAARAIAAAAGTPHAGEAPLLAARVETRPGLGVSGVVAGRALRLGRPDFALGAKAAVAGSGIAAEDTVLLADDDGAIAAFTLTERLRADAAAAVAALASQGLVLSIASGDSPAKVRAIAQRLGIADWRARLLPGDKLAWLEALRAAGERVIAVGDGVNDAPVLGGADVAVALAEGAELAQASSDIVLTGGRLCGLAPARRIAQQALHVLRQNQRWAFCYNFAAVPLAALGFVPPWLAALGMSFSSLVVVLNAMRIGSAAALDRAPALGGAGRSAEGGLDPTARLAP